MRALARRRLDAELVRRGLFASRSEAESAVRDGLVLVSGSPAEKPSTLVDPADPLELVAPARRFVSRGGDKLSAALDRFGVDPAGRRALDAGASTGGFTDCLLQHGAARVWAVDVGHNQLVWRLRQDPRVVVLEGVNARNLDPGQFPVRFDLATIDVSFISLTKILPAVLPCLTDAADCISLIKPQFEVGKGEVGRGGVVTDRLKHKRVLTEIKDAATVLGLRPVGLIESPILGAEGNREFLMHLGVLCGS